MAFAASIALPPPTPMTRSAPNAFATATPRATISMDGFGVTPRNSCAATPTSAKSALIFASAPATLPSP